MFRKGISMSVQSEDLPFVDKPRKNKNNNKDKRSKTDKMLHKAKTGFKKKIEEITENELDEERNEY